MIANRFVIADVVRLVPLASLTTVTARVSNPIRAEVPMCRQISRHAEKTVCDTALFCQDDSAGCFDTAYAPDQEEGQAIVMMEAAREAGVYGVDPNKVEIFKGYREECSSKVLGESIIKNCCRAVGGGEKWRNYALLGAGVSVAGEAGRETVRMGSKYVYDALYNQVDSSLVNKGLDAINKPVV